MLKQLSINNYILIKHLELDLSDGFTVITGETGAGKSILVGALSLILGKRADTDVLLDKESKCVIEGTFLVKDYGLESYFEEHELDYEELTVLRREINKQGKSRAFINDTPVNLPVLKTLGEKLVDIHSQHETLMLNELGFQLAILDDLATNTGLLSKYSDAYTRYNAFKSDLDLLIQKESGMREEEDYLKFQFEEMDAAAIQTDEIEKLEGELKLLSHAEEIKGGLFNATQALSLSDGNILDNLLGQISSLSKIAGYHQEVSELKGRLESLGIEMKDVASELERLEESIQHDPQRLEEVSSRIDLIYALLQKHKVNNINELLQIRTQIEDRLLGISNLDEDIAKLKAEMEKAGEESLKLASELSKKRKNVVPLIEKEIRVTLERLGMEDGIFKIMISDLEKLTSTGYDGVSFNFSANKGSKPAPITKIASGGELSRLMLALKSLITRKSLLPTIILDEIDMGVSGDIAAKVGKLLDSMSANMQLIAITHLPQIAGRAGKHFKVFKKYADDRTVSGVKCLSDIERIDEIALMLSNEDLSEAAKTTAKELLAKK
ncbi:MAG: DNA repair protein RecN [Bacteroidetes bacterium]|nr:MAG: DNA repair protein RecN [Bacteroidota bacterium]